MFNLFKKPEPQIIEKIVEVEKVVYIEKEHQETLEEQLSYVDIRDRRKGSIYLPYLWRMEKLIFEVLNPNTNATKEKKGEQLVNLTIEIFQNMGYKAQNNDGLNDGKKDILVFRKDEEEPFLVIQCKNYNPTSTTRILDGDISQFMSRTEEYGKNRIYITTSYFQSYAVKELADKITLIDRVGFIRLLLKYFPEATINALNSLSLSDLEYDCPKCTIGKIRLVFNKNIPFYKCTNCNYEYDSQNNKPNFKKAKYKEY